MGMFKNMRQDAEIRAANARSSSAGHRASQAQDRLKDLDKRLDHLTLYCQAMWELIRENTRLEEDDIVKKANEIDMRDGKADGKIQAALLVCSVCHRNNNSQKKKCMYCNAELQRDHVFEG